jgi:glutathione S-transferase
VTARLVHLAYSPWSERARWALDARGVPWEGVEYQPLLGELHLWWLRRGAPGPVSVPVLLPDDGPPICDSEAIARWAAARGGGPDLFPAGREHELAAITGLAERALAAGRARALRRAEVSREAVQELVPPYLTWAGPVSRAVARAGIRRTARKYAAASDADSELTLRAALGELQALVTAGAGAGPLLGGFSYADIAACQAVGFVVPERSLRAGPGTRASFEDRGVAADFAALIAWRDEIYARYRGGRRSEDER